MQPGIDNFIHGAQDKAFDQTDVKIPANAAVLLAGFNDFRNQVLIHLGHLPDLGFRQAAALMGFNLIHHGHVWIPLKFHKMPPDKVPQFIQAVVGLVDGGPEAVKNLFGSVVKKMNQDIVFVLEIKIDGTIGHTGFPGNLGNGRLVKTLARKDFYGCFKDKMVLVVFIFFIDFRPPVTLYRNHM